MFRSAAFAALLTLPALAAADLETDLRARFAEAGLSEDARLAVTISRADTGERLVEINANEPMKPASTTKLFTAAAAVDRLGPDYHVTTRVFTDGGLNAEADRLEGNLFIRGGGDPGLGPRFQEDKSAVTRVFREWAQFLKDRGVSEIGGDVVGDDRLFTGPHTGLGWYPEERAEWYMAEITALTFNDGCVDLHFHAPGSPGKETRVEIVPDVDYFNFQNKVLSVPTEAGTDIDLFRNEEENRHVAIGTVAVDSERTRWTAVHDPAGFTAAVLLDEFEAQDIEVGGRAHSTSDAVYQDAPQPEDLKILITHDSAPLSEQLVPILSSSQNLYAEMVGRWIALEAGQEPSFEGVSDTLTEWAGENGLRRNGFVLMDASGLSSVNRIPARALNDLLLWMDGSEHAALFHESMARAGERGSLRARLSGLTGRFHAKTGSLGDTSTVAGWLITPAGDEYVITVMIDSTGGAQAVLDSLMLFIDERLSDPGMAEKAAETSSPS